MVHDGPVLGAGLVGRGRDLRVGPAVETLVPRCDRRRCRDRDRGGGLALPAPSPRRRSARTRPRDRRRRDRAGTARGRGHLPFGAPAH